MLGNISDNQYNFEPESRETKFGTLEDAKTFKVYFDGKEKDFFRTFYPSDDGQSKFGDERINGKARHYTFDTDVRVWHQRAASFKELIAELLGHLFHMAVRSLDVLYQLLEFRCAFLLSPAVVLVVGVEGIVPEGALLSFGL